MSRSANQDARFLRPWLEDKINSGNIHGIEWVIKEEKIFKIAWYRVQPGNNSALHFQIFVEWAKNKGRYNEQEPEYKKWKTQLRCAMNKARDIRHLVEMSDEKCAEPFRMYQFLNEQDSQGFPQQRLSSEGSTNSSQSAFPDGGHFLDVNGCDQNNVVPIVVEEMNSNSSTEGVSNPPSTQTQHDELFQLPHLDNNVTSVLGAAADSYKAEMNSDPTRIQDMNAEQSTDILTDHRMQLRILYRGICVHDPLISNLKGCILYSGDTKQLGQSYLKSEMQEQLYGPDDLDEIRFPLDEGRFVNPVDHDDTRRLLEFTDRGLQLESNDEGVFVTRRCRCSIFWDSHLTPDGPEKLIRQQKVKIFDRCKFVEAAQRFAGNDGPKPRCEIQLGIGQKWVYGENVNDVLVAVSIVTRSSEQIIKLIEKSRGAPSVAYISAETPTDEFLEQIRALSLQDQPMSQ